MSLNRPFMLIILDGWGSNIDENANAVFSAHTPVLDGLAKEYATTRLHCSGEAVGLPAGFMGNSEVGHLNIGAGRVVYQDLMRIDNAIQDGTFFKNTVLSAVMDQVKENGTALHFMGLASESGVHSHLNHLYALLKMASARGVGQAYVHAITDGRDSPPDSGIDFIQQIQHHLDATQYGAIATICGRYYAMDRDKRWERTQTAYKLYAQGDGVQETLPKDAVSHAYHRGETDEFIKPVVMVDGKGAPKGPVKDGDGIIIFNFRADRVRQITNAFTNPGFMEFDRNKALQFSAYACMTTYDETFELPVAFSPVRLNKILGEVVSKQGLRQLRIAETEKYAHVTYFFNGGEETPFPLEDRCLIPSPKEVPTYDHKPEMSAIQVTDELLNKMKTGYDFIVLNFANMDMVGHTGIMPAAVKACETVDRCLGKILEELKLQNGVAIITADHGNAEKMKEENGNPYTAHTLNPVPLILVDDTRKTVALREGVLGDIAPTLLDMMEIEKPKEMTGNTLIEN
jgi:2,3-bisphosphoglycerate-independent phosphoglycerate mutase